MRTFTCSKGGNSLGIQHINATKKLTWRLFTNMKPHNTIFKGHELLLQGTTITRRGPLVAQTVCSLQINEGLVVPTHTGASWKRGLASAFIMITAKNTLWSAALLCNTWYSHESESTAWKWLLSLVPFCRDFIAHSNAPKNMVASVEREKGRGLQRWRMLVMERPPGIPETRALGSYMKIRAMRAHIN